MLIPLSPCFEYYSILFIRRKAFLPYAHNEKSKEAESKTETTICIQQKAIFATGIQLVPIFIASCLGLYILDINDSILFCQCILKQRILLIRVLIHRYCIHFTRYVSYRPESPWKQLLYLLLSIFFCFIKEESHVCFQLIYKYPSTFVCLS